MTSQLDPRPGESGTRQEPAAAEAASSVLTVARDVLETLLAKMGFQARVEARLETDVILLEVIGQDTALIIGRKGGTLEALQVLTNKIVRRLTGESGEGEARRGLPVILDVEGYRERRNQGIYTMALQLADKVKSTGRTIAVLGMKAADRRVVHLALTERPEVASHSEGEGRGRQLLLSPREDSERGSGGGR
jgi:spoIIIJ-associated protein